MSKAHVITERKNPLRVFVICSCGWRHSESRAQNALGRAAKIRAAIRAHLEKSRG